MKQLEEFIDRHSRWEALRIYPRRIRAAVKGDGGVLVSNCKELIESISKTILVDHFNEDIGHNPKFQNLVNQTCRKLGAINHVADLMKAFSSMATGLGTLRNKNSDAGHGRAVSELERVPSEITQATSDCIASVCEQIALFLLRVYEHEHPRRVLTTSLQYSDDPGFNESIDEVHDSIEIAGYGPYAASEILHAIDPVAYRTLREEFRSDVERIVKEYSDKVE